MDLVRGQFRNNGIQRAHTHTHTIGQKSSIQIYRFSNQMESINIYMRAVMMVVLYYSNKAH